METCFSNHRGAGDGVLQTIDLSSMAINKSLFSTAAMNKWIIPQMATESRMIVCAAMPAPTPETGSDEASHLRTGMRGKTNLYSDAPPIIIGGTGMMRGKTNLYSDAPLIITGHKTSSKFSVDHEILLDSSFEYDGDSVLTAEMAKSTEWGADPMVGPRGLNLQQLFAGNVKTSSSNQGSGILERGFSSRILARPDQHCIDFPAAKQDIYAMIPDAGGRRAALMACVGEQAAAGIVANQIAAAGSNALALYFMVLAIMFGLTFKLAAVALKGNTRCPNLSIWVGKIGDMLTASAIILSLAVHLPPLMAYIAAPLAFGIIALAIAFA